MKIIDAVNFVRFNDILKDWTNEQIAIGILSAIKHSAITWTTDTDGNIDGICFGRWENNAISFHVVAIAGKSTPRKFLKYLKETFPQCKRITGFKKLTGETKEFKLL